MKTKAIRNLLYDGAFYRAGEEVDLPDTLISEYQRRGLIDSSNSVELKDNVLNELPPLDVGRRKK